MVAVGELANPMESREGAQGVGERWKASVRTRNNTGGQRARFTPEMTQDRVESMKRAIRLAETRRDPRQVTCGYEQGGRVREEMARHTQLCASYCRFCHPSQGECDGDGEGSVDNDASSALSSALSLSLCCHCVATFGGKARWMSGGAKGGQEDEDARKRV